MSKPTTEQLLEAAWGLIANAGGGDWGTQTEEWQRAAKTWRDDYSKPEGLALVEPLEYRTPPRFAIGDVVQLNGGGPRMTVLKPRLEGPNGTIYREGYVLVAYEASGREMFGFGGGRRLEREQYHPDTLSLVARASDLHPFTADDGVAEAIGRG